MQGKRDMSLKNRIASSVKRLGNKSKIGGGGFSWWDVVWHVYAIYRIRKTRRGNSLVEWTELDTLTISPKPIAGKEGVVIHGVAASSIRKALKRGILPGNLAQHFADCSDRQAARVASANRHPNRLVMMIEKAKMGVRS